MKKDKWIEYAKFWEYYYSRGVRGWSEFAEVVDSLSYAKFWEYYYSRGLRGWSEFGRVVDSLSGEDSTLYVLALCVGKWHPKNKFRGLGGMYTCALCLSSGDCGHCPLGRVGQQCMRRHSHYENFERAFLEDDLKRRAVAADAMYNLLISLYTKEWKKLTRKNQHA